MKRIYYIMTALFFCVASVNAQIRVGNTSDPHEGAILDLKSTETANKGLLLTNVNLIALDDFTVLGGDATKGEGMVIYNTNETLGKGLYVWNGEQWLKMYDADGDGKEPTPDPELPVVMIASDVNATTIAAGDPVELTATVMASGSTPTYQWFKNGSKLDETGFTLSIGAIAFNDQYSCIVTDNVGSTTAYWSICGAYISATEWLPFMCHNLGADESKDPFTYDEAIVGDFYQWGRKADGHEKHTSGSILGPIDAADCDADGQVATMATDYYGKFIINYSYEPYDWRDPQKDDLWDATKTVSDPCPEGWKVPTQSQWTAVIDHNQAIINYDNQGLKFSDSLFLPAAGSRTFSEGIVSSQGSFGYYWSSSANGISSFILVFGNNYPKGYVYYYFRAFGNSVRCVADN